MTWRRLRIMKTGRRSNAKLGSGTAAFSTNKIAWWREWLKSIPLVPSRNRQEEQECIAWQSRSERQSPARNKMSADANNPQFMPSTDRHRAAEAFGKRQCDRGTAQSMAVGAMVRLSGVPCTTTFTQAWDRPHGRSPINAPRSSVLQPNTPDGGRGTQWNPALTLRARQNWKYFQCTSNREGAALNCNINWATQNSTLTEAIIKNLRIMTTALPSGRVSSAWRWLQPDGAYYMTAKRKIHQPEQEAPRYQLTARSHASNSRMLWKLRTFRLSSQRTLEVSSRASREQISASQPGWRASSRKHTIRKSRSSKRESSTCARSTAEPRPPRRAELRAETQAQAAALAGAQAQAQAHAHTAPPAEFKVKFKQQPRVRALQAQSKAQPTLWTSTPPWSQAPPLPLTPPPTSAAAPTMKAATLATTTSMGKHAPETKQAKLRIFDEWSEKHSQLVEQKTYLNKVMSWTSTRVVPGGQSNDSVKVKTIWAVISVFKGRDKLQFWNRLSEFVTEKEVVVQSGFRRRSLHA